MAPKSHTKKVTHIHLFNLIATNLGWEAGGADQVVLVGVHHQPLVWQEGVEEKYSIASRDCAEKCLAS